MADDPVARLAELQAERGKAVTHLDKVEAGAREAGAAVQQAVDDLAQAETSGSTARRLTELGTALGKARDAADRQLWLAREAAARAAIREVDVQIRQCTAENLDSLVAGLEQDGAVIVERINRGAAEVVAGHHEWQALASKIGQVIGQVARPGPHDVSRSLSDEAAQACQALLGQGGEQAPRLDRRNAPWDSLLGSEAEAVPDSEAVSA